MKEELIVRYEKMKHWLQQNHKENWLRNFVNVLGINNENEAKCYDSNAEHEPIYRVLFNILLIALTFASLVFIINLVAIVFSDHNPGTFGDFFGGILNPIFTLFMLFGLIVTIVVQRQELKEARKEFRKSADALGTQVFDNTFFNLIELHHKIIDSLRVDYSLIRDILSYENKDNYKDTLIKVAKEAALLSMSAVGGRTIGNIDFDNQSNTLPENMIFEGRQTFDAVFNFISVGTENTEVVLQRYVALQKKHNEILGHYFRNLYQILKLVDREGPTIDRYTGILRAQLSSTELALLAINCLDDIVDNGKFRELLIKYRMLEHLPIEYDELGLKLAGSSMPVICKHKMEQYMVSQQVRFNINIKPAGAFGHNPYFQNSSESK